MGERDLGVQPLDGLMEAWGLSNHDLVDTSEEQLSHKQVRRARTGRMLTLKMMMKLNRTLNIAIWNRLTGAEREDYFEYGHAHLFNYAKGHNAGWEDPNGELQAALRDRAK
jgi:hypothetical protein